MKTELAQSGVVCRYLCQAVPGCTHWTFLIPQDEAGACFMYNTSVPMASPSEELSKVVSGARFCTPEPLSMGTPRSSNLSQERIYQATTDVEEVAAAIQQQGWAVLRGAVPSALLEILKLEVPKAAEKLLHQDPQRIGNRGAKTVFVGRVIHIPSHGASIFLGTITWHPSAGSGSRTCVSRRIRGHWRWRWLCVGRNGFPSTFTCGFAIGSHVWF